MTEIQYTDADGNPLTLLEWGDLFENPRRRFLGEQVIPGFGIIRLVYIGTSIHQCPDTYHHPFGLALYSLYPIDTYEREIKTYPTKEAGQLALENWACVLADHDPNECPVE